MSLLQNFLILILALFWLAWKPAQYFSGPIVGRVAPVVEPARLYNERPSPPPAYRYLWSASSVKLQECGFIRIEWFLGQRNGPAAYYVAAEFLDPPQYRGEGVLEWDALAINLDPLEVRKNSYAYVWHDCEWWPFPVRSLFYDSALEERPL